VGELSQSPGIVRSFIKPDECGRRPSSGFRCNVSRQFAALIGSGMWISRRTRMRQLMLLRSRIPGRNWGRGVSVRRGRPRVG
jgi:hypothetical protein